MKRLGMAVAVTMAMSSFARAEPGPTVTKLMNEPTSLFHYGLDRLRDKLEADIEQYPSYVFYDWQANRIVLNFNQSKKTDQEEKGIEERCNEFFKILRARAGLDKDGQAYDKDGSRFARYFLPSGYANASLQGVGAEVDQILTVNFVVGQRRCSAPLLGTGFSLN